MNAMTTIDPPKRNEAIQVYDPIPLLDTSRFEHMQRIAGTMAACSLIPDALRGNTAQATLANCFLVVNQAVRWNMDPFAVAQSVSVVRGKLCYEGKLVAAVIEQKLGVRLRYEWNDKRGDDFGVVVSGQFPDGRIETIDGTVGQWQTRDKEGKISNQWKSLPKLMLAYRGSREWARLFAPGVMLGVYTDDELQDMQEGAKAVRARDVTPPRAIASDPEPARSASPPSPPRASAPPAAQRQSSPPPAQKTRPEPQDSEPKPDLEDMVSQFEEDSLTAQTLEDLGDCASELLPYVNGDRSHLMGRELRTRAENAWTDAEKRITAARSKPQAQQDEDEEPAIDPEDPDYLKGRMDFVSGKSKCLKAEIRDNPERHAKWQRGFLDAKNDAENEGDA
jgi:hypothetical protein